MVNQQIGLRMNSAKKNSASVVFVKGVKINFSSVKICRTKVNFSKKFGWGLTFYKNSEILLIVMNTSYKPEVLVDGTWSCNSLRFATAKEAEASAHELMSRWFVAEDGRASTSDDAVNYRFDFVTASNVRL